MRPFRTREAAQDWVTYRTDLPAGVLVPAPRRRRWPGIRAAAVAPVLRPVRRLARSVAAETAVFLLVAAFLAAVHHTALAQLSPPSPPAAVCGSPSLDGPSSAPPGSVTVPAGDNSGFDFATPGTVYWFAPGTHTVGSGQFSQIQPAQGSTYEGAPGAVVSGQGLNQFAFAGTSSDVTIEYLTIEDFIPPGGQGAVNIDGEPGWTVDYNTLTDNVPGAGMMVGSGNTVTGNCMTANGEYGFNAFTVNDVNPVTGGPAGIVMTGNEISYNDTCNWEDQSDFPITPPSGCDGAGQYDGCGCSGAGKFWEAADGVFDDNYVLGNYSTGAWWDTNDAGWQIDDNYFAGNWGGGVTYEISYNAQISGNTFVGNAQGSGPTNPGFPATAVYISESGADPRVPGPYGNQLQITGNYFYDNWGGVVLWENANRYCSSVANSSTGTCTLVNLTPPLNPATSPQAPSQPLWRRGLPGAGRTYGNFSPPGPVISLQTCSEQQYLDVAPWINDCRWKTQNVLISGNLFDFDPADTGAGCTADNGCGFNGVFSEYGTFPPYLGDFVENNITFSQGNLFTSNTYCGPWMFDALAQGNAYDFATWQGSPYGQDPGSTLNGPACTPAPAAPPVGGPRAPVPFPVQIPVPAGRR